MSCYKLISDGVIIDILQTPYWVRQNIRGMTVCCDVSRAQGVLSSDGSKIYQIIGAATMDDFEEIEIACITKEQYDEIQSVMGLGGVVYDDANIQWPEEPEPEIEVPDENLEQAKIRKMKQLRDACSDMICNGIEVKLSDKSVKHFGMTAEDQINMLDAQMEINAGAAAVQYHANGEQYMMYSADDMRLIINAARAHRQYHTAYYGCLKAWVMNLDTIATIGSIAYGDAIPKAFCSDVYVGLRG